MQHFRSLEDVHLQNAWLSIGSFDGVHLGHQEIIQVLTAGAHEAGAPAVVLTFHPHPSVVLGKRHDPFYLTSPEDRAALLGALGVDVVVTHPFNMQLAGMAARDFMRLVKDRLGVNHLIIGHDFALGRKREGDAPMLEHIGEELDYSLHVHEPVKNGNVVISSSLIRAALSEGDVTQAARLLGRPYQVSGKVIHGDGRGRTIGIPTANLQVWAERAIPKAGVYACRAQIGEKSWRAVTNIGVRPTFEDQPLSTRVETHLLEFDQDLYEQEIKLEFIARIRDEQKFPNVQALVDQIHADIATAKEVL